MKNNIHPAIEAAEKSGVQLIEIKGYLGTSKDKTVRLYVNLSIQNYMEVPKEAVIHTEPSSHISGYVHLFVPADTIIRHVQEFNIRADVYTFELPNDVSKLLRILGHSQSMVGYSPSSWPSGVEPSFPSNFFINQDAARCTTQLNRCMYSPRIMSLRDQIASTSDPGLKATLEEFLESELKKCDEAFRRCMAAAISLNRF